MLTKIVRTAALVGFLLAALAPAQIVGTTLRYQDFKGFQHSKAKSIGDYQGRLLLIEFFAYW